MLLHDYVRVEGDWQSLDIWAYCWYKMPFYKLNRSKWTPSIDFRLPIFMSVPIPS